MGISSAGLEPGIRRHHDGGRPILGTCAGMIVCDDAHLGLIDAHARRNAFGRQLQSFETDLRVEGLGDEPLRAIFIRAPWIERTGPGVEVLAAYRGPPGGDPRGLGAQLRLPPRAERRSARPRAVHGNGDLRGRAKVPPTRGGEQLKDPRVQGLARILVGYSTKVKPGEIVSIDGESPAEPLLAAVYEEVLKAGANPILNMSLDGQAATYFKHAGDAQLDWVSPVAEWMVENVDVRISVGASTNTRELSAVPPERQTRRQAAMGELMGRAMERSAEGAFRWCYTLFPTGAYASEAEMSTEDYEDFYYGACLATDPDPLTAWERASSETRRLAEWIEGHEEVHVTAPGHRHPAGDRRAQVHPLRRRPQHARRGVLHRPGRGLGRGRGQLPPAGGDRRQGGLGRAAALRVGQGGRRRGRARRGVPDQAARHRRGRPPPRRAGDRHQLRDRPRHAARCCSTRRSAARSTWRSARSYPESGGVNESAVHTDLVCDLRQGGKIVVDGEELSVDGKFVV